jgi:hypothetical protein
MPHTALGDGVRYVRTSRAGELQQRLEPLAERLRRGVIADIDERGQAYCFDCAAQCAWYLRCEGAEVLVWQWTPIETYWEAAILRSLILSLDQPLSAELAMALRERATNRRVELMADARRYEAREPEFAWSTAMLRAASSTGRRLAVLFGTMNRNALRVKASRSDPVPG